MKMEAFTTLDLVLRHGSLANAAQEAHLTASAVSLQMKQLEQYLGHPLFDRSGLQVKPLPLADRVAEIMRRAMADIESLRQPTSIEVQGNIRLGVIESMQALLLPDMLTQLRKQAPKLHVTPRRGKSAVLTQAVKAGELDAAVVAEPEHSTVSRLSWHGLWTQALSLIVPPTEKLRDPNALFAKYEWIRYDRSTVAGRMATQYVSRHIDQARGSLEFDGVRAIAAMISAGLGVSIVQLSEPGISTVSPVQVIALKQAPTLRFSLVTRSADTDKRSLQLLLQTLQQVVADKNL